MNPLASGVATDLAVDGRALERLKRDAARDPRTAIRQAAQQFEALFMQMVLKSMRDATPKSGLLDSSANEMYTGMLDQQIAVKVAAAGTGLADVIAQQLARHMRPAESTAPVVRPATTVPAAAAPAPQPTPQATPAAPPSAERRDFMTKMWDHALVAERATGVPAKFILGQAALESGWGRREIRTADGLPSYNLFGIKAGAGWKGRTVDVITTEYDNGVAKKVVEKFRAYNNYTDAFRDWAALMANNPRYAGVLAAGRGDAHGFAQAMQRAGYATDPGYAAKLTRVIAAAPLRGTA